MANLTSSLKKNKHNKLQKFTQQFQQKKIQEVKDKKNTAFANTK